MRWERPLDGLGAMRMTGAGRFGRRLSMARLPLPLDTRDRSASRCSTGLRVLDSMLTVGRGQRDGDFWRLGRG